jgi:hypothetical protein
MAGKEVDRLTDRSLTYEERERRKRRLTKGPSEFSELRDDQSKQKQWPRRARRRPSGADGTCYS